MEQYYYNHMNKAQQAAYHSILSGVKNLADEFQIPALEGEELYNVFFQMRLDHPEIFWVSSYKYRYYKDSPNLIFIPEYLFDKKKIMIMFFLRIIELIYLSEFSNEYFFQRLCI